MSESTSRRAWWSPWLRGLMLVLGLGAVAYVIRDAGPQRVFATFLGASAFLPVIVLLEALFAGMDVLALRAIIGEPAKQVPARVWLQSGMAAYGVMVLLPGGRAAGEVVRATQLAPYLGGVRAAGFATRLQASTLLANTAVSIPASIACLAVAGTAAALPWMVFGNGVLTLILGLAILAMARRSRLGAWLGTKLGSARGTEFDEAMRVETSLVVPVLWTCLGRAFQTLQYGVLLLAVGGALTPRGALISQGIHLVGAGLGDFVPNQVGITEGAYRVFADALGLASDPARAVGIALLARFCQLSLALVGIVVGTMGGPKEHSMFSAVEGVLSRLASLQSRRPWVPVVAALLIMGVALPSVANLELNPDFQALLPEGAPSVRDLDEIRRRVPGTATLSIALQANEGHGIDTLREVARQVAPRIEGHAELGITGVDWNVSDFERFVSDHRHLYADLDDLTEIRDVLSARMDYERARANPFFIDLEDAPPPDVEAVFQRIEADAAEARRTMDRFPAGYFQDPELPIVFVFVRTNIAGGDMGAVARVIEAVEDELESVVGTPASARRSRGTEVGAVFAAFRADYGGDLMDMVEENDALREAVALSTLITFALLAVSIYLFFRRVRAVVLLAVVLVPPCLTAFGIAEPFVDYLNASSAFLGSIVIGNGVNSSIMWLGRYFEERRAGRSAPEAVGATHLGTWQGTLAAAVGAGLAYASLMTTDYRGFRDFGFIGLLGMMLCWVAAYALMPSLVLISERVRPLRFDAETTSRSYGSLAAKIATDRGAKVVAALSILATIVSILAVVTMARGNPLEYDFRRLQSVRSPTSRVAFVNSRVAVTITETQHGSAIAVLAPDAVAAGILAAQLRAHRAEHPGILGEVRTMDDLLPANMVAKLPVLAEVRRLLLEIRPQLTPEQQRQVDSHLPPENIAPLSFADLPICVARPFVERDGTRGRMLFVEHADGASNWDGRYLIQWAEAVRSARLPDGSSPAVAGVAVVFADLLESLYSDVPQTILLAFVVTLLLVLITFRGWRDRLLSVVSMVLGTVWMTGALALFGIKLNFLNMVAFPITFGIGLEYAVNFVKRWREEVAGGASDVDAARISLEGAGGAVILCSLTTLIGYLSLFVSSNQGLNSFGTAMATSEITCLVAAIWTVPAIIILLARKKLHDASKAQ